MRVEQRVRLTDNPILTYNNYMHRTILLFISVLFIMAPGNIRAQAATDGFDVHQTGVVDAYPDFRIATITVTFPDHPAIPTIEGTTNPWTKAYVDGVMFSNTDSMAAFYSVLSGQRMTVTGDVYDRQGQWYEIPRPATINGVCDWGSYFDDAVAAADADIDYTRYNAVFVFAPHMECSTGGKSYSVVAPDTGGQWYLAASIDGSMGSTPHHELGHLVGMDHANSWQCDPPGVLTGTNCRSEEYADRFSVMGVSSRMLYPATPHLENLGWISSTDVQVVTTDGDYLLRPYETDGSLPRALKIPQTADPVTGAVTSWYYLEYRQAIGFDNIPRTPTIQELGVTNGVLVHLGSGEGAYITTTLLDMTPGSLGKRDIFDPALPLGSSYTDPAAGVSFGVLSRSSTAMTIRVKFGGTSLCQQGKPTVTRTIIKGKAKRGGELRYQISVKNNDILCGNQAFVLRTTKKDPGWTATFEKKTVLPFDLLPGQKKTFAVRIGVPSKTKLGRHGLTFEARQKQYPVLKKSITIQPTVVAR